MEIDGVELTFGNQQNPDLNDDQLEVLEKFVQDIKRIIPIKSGITLKPIICGKCGKKLTKHHRCKSIIK